MINIKLIVSGEEIIMSINENDTFLHFTTQVRQACIAKGLQPPAQYYAQTQHYTLRHLSMSLAQLGFKNGDMLLTSNIVSPAEKAHDMSLENLRGKMLPIIQKILVREIAQYKIEIEKYRILLTTKPLAAPTPPILDTLKARELITLCYSHQIISKSEIRTIITDIESLYSPERLVPTDSPEYVIYIMLGLMIDPSAKPAQLVEEYPAEEKIKEKTLDEKIKTTAKPNILSLPKGIDELLFSFPDVGDVARFSITSHTAKDLVDDKTVFWTKKIAEDFKVQLPKDKCLLKSKFIYQQLVVFHKLPENNVRRFYSKDDPALFQSALSGDIRNLDLFRCLKKAVRVGNLALVQWLTSEDRGSQQVYLNQEMLNDAAASGNLAMLRWMVLGSPRLIPNKETFSRAVQSGNLGMVQWLTSPKRGLLQIGLGYSTLSKALYDAAASGNLALMKWFLARKPDPKFTSFFDRGQPLQIEPLMLHEAARSGDISLIQWLMSPEQEALREFIRDGVDKGSYNTHLYRPIYFLIEVARSGNLNLIQWLMLPAHEAERLYPNQNTLRIWLNNDGFVSSIMYNAAQSGNLKLVQWLMSSEHGMQPLNPGQNTLYSAIESGNLNLIRWLTSADRGAQRVNPNQRTLSRAALSGNLGLVQWAMSSDHGAQQPNPHQKMLNNAAGLGELDLVQWLMSSDRGAQRINPNQETLDMAALSGNLSLVQWLMSLDLGTQGISPNQKTLDSAARSGNLSLVQWLMSLDYATQRVNFNQSTLSAAKESGNIALIKWLEQRLKLQNTITLPVNKKKDVPLKIATPTIPLPLPLSPVKDKKRNVDKIAILVELDFSALPPTFQQLLKGPMTELQRQIKGKTAANYWDNCLPIGGKERQELAKDFLGQNKHRSAPMTITLAASSLTAPGSPAVFAVSSATTASVALQQASVVTTKRFDS